MPMYRILTGQYEIPKGTAVFINHHNIHMNDDLWMNPEVFDPTRYLDDNGQMTRTPTGWLPFSAGRRVCLGETISKYKLVTVLSIFLHQFKITPPAGETADIGLAGTSFGCEPKQYEIVMTPHT